MFVINKPELLTTLNIKFFSEDPPPADPGAPQDPPPAKDTDPAQATYTEEDFQKRLQEELAKVTNKHTDDLAAARTEAEKLAKMNADEKAIYELEQREKALADKEHSIATRELRAETLKALADKDTNLPAEVLDLVIGADAETTTQNIKTFKKVFDAAVQTAVEARLAGKTPTVGTGTAAKGAEEQAREQFAKALGGY